MSTQSVTSPIADDRPLLTSWAMNAVTRRFGLNKKRHVGATSELIRAAAPRSLEEWVRYYEAHGPADDATFATLAAKGYAGLRHMAREIASITQADYETFLRRLVFEQTYDGYLTELQVSRERLVAELGLELEPAPDAWDRGYAVDLIARLPGGVLGLQVKPMSYEQAPTAHQLLADQIAAHARFRTEVGGEAIVVVFGPRTQDGEPALADPSVIGRIREAIARLGG